MYESRNGMTVLDVEVVMGTKRIGWDDGCEHTAMLQMVGPVIEPTPGRYISSGQCWKNKNPPYALSHKGVEVCVSQRLYIDWLVQKNT